MKFISISILVTLLFSFGCRKSPTDAEKPNELPVAFLWIYPPSEDSLALGISKQRIHWWGEDNDGYLKGFLVGIGKTEESASWSFKTNNDSLVAFPLQSDKDTFIVFIRAIDNHLREIIIDGSTIVLTSIPFIDNDRNDSLSSGDIELPSLIKAMGVTAKQKFPIKNLPPSVAFEKTSDGITIQPPDTSFTVVTFSWLGSDPDGDNTITKYQIALNDTSPDKWTTLDSTVNFVTLVVSRDVSNNSIGEVPADIYLGKYSPSMRRRGQVRGLRLDDNNRLYLRAIDLGEDTSAIIQLPDTGRTWFVKKPKSALLLIEDYIGTSGINSPDSVREFYRNIFTQIPNSPYIVSDSVRNFDIISFRSNAGASIPKYQDPQLILTLQLFDYVFWYAGRVPTWQVATRALLLYASDLNTTGRVLFSTGFNNTLPPVDTIASFTPIESTSSSTDSTASRAYPDTTISDIDATDSLPQLSFRESQSAHSFFEIRNMYPRSTSQAMYQIDSLISKPPSLRKFNPTIGVRDLNNRFIMMGVPLHILNGINNNGERGLPLFLNKVFGDIFKRQIQ
ncbi:MAG: hypothetical protein KGZ58_06660 [Ignavibacteriales bacterium]|nr:hypothetical protein [Ignavibacteriales bacterium]